MECFYIFVCVCVCVFFFKMYAMIPYIASKTCFIMTVVPLCRHSDSNCLCSGHEGHSDTCGPTSSRVIRQLNNEHVWVERDRSTVAHLALSIQLRCCNSSQKHSTIWSTKCLDTLVLFCVCGDCLYQRSIQRVFHIILYIMVLSVSCILVW